MFWTVWIWRVWFQRQSVAELREVFWILSLTFHVSRSFKASSSRSSSRPPSTWQQVRTVIKKKCDKSGALFSIIKPYLAIRRVIEDVSHDPTNENETVNKETNRGSQTQPVCHETSISLKMYFSAVKTDTNREHTNLPYLERTFELSDTTVFHRKQKWKLKMEGEVT